MRERDTRKLGLLPTEQLLSVRVVEKAHLLNFNLIPDWFELKPQFLSTIAKPNRGSNLQKKNTLKHQRFSYIGYITGMLLQF